MRPAAWRTARHALDSTLCDRQIGHDSRQSPTAPTDMPCGRKRKRHKIATHKRKKRLRKNRHKKKNR